MAERAWPFEGQKDLEPVRRPEQFVEQLDGAGAWQRWVYHSVEEATEIAEALGVPVHVGEYPEELRVRINSYQRPSADFDKHAYPEQGGVGPVMPYPENRPRRADVLTKEVAAEAQEGQNPA